jgi:hypothetical protein
MPIFENKGTYLLMLPNKAYALETYLEAIWEALRVCDKNGLTGILADVRSLDQTIPVSDRFKLGVEFANLLGAKYKLAILARPDFIDRTGENTAVNRGGQVFVTSSMDEATKWLEAIEG